MVVFPSRPGSIAGALDVGIELGQKRVQIIGIPRLDGALDGLDVLLDIALGVSRAGLGLAE